MVGARRACYMGPMPIGTDGLAADLLSPRLTTGDGPGAYDRLLLEFRALRDDPALLAPLERAWAGRPFDGSFARPMLLLAALRYRALLDADHPLAPEVLLDGEAPELRRRLVEALGDPELVPVLATRSVRGHDPGRALAWGLVALALDLPHRRFALVDLAAVAGLHLVVDLTSIPYRLGAEKVTGLDFPSPHARLGLDAAPVAVHDEDAVQWLRAGIWPGQPDRADRFEAALEVLRRPWRGASPAPALAPHTLGGDDTAAQLAAVAADPAVDAVIAFETMATAQLSPEAAAAHRRTLEAWVAGGPKRLWLTFDPAPAGPTGSGGGPLSLTVHTAQAGTVAPLEIARAAYHPASCLIVPGAIAALRARWRAP